MGWKGYEGEMPAGMLFKKMYCAKCGEKLKRQKVTKTIKKGEEGYQNDILGKPTLGMTEITKAGYIYVCPGCKAETTYEQQTEIAKIQKLLNKKIIGV